ncbi:MAG TPA: T9SS type A sorting domain-containing protein [Bacteroidia bacterium]|nr:T9SS type A sorting domain-containing protein [Bacteroidia bacterium]
MKKLFTTLAVLFFTLIYSPSFAQWHKLTLPSIYLGNSNGIPFGNQTVSISSNNNIFYGRAQMDPTYFEFGVVGTNDDFNTYYNVYTDSRTNGDNLLLHALNDSTCQISYRDILYTATKNTSRSIGNLEFTPFFSIKQHTYAVNYISAASTPGFTANVYYLNTSLSTKTLKDTINNISSYGNLYFTNDSTGYFLNYYLPGNYFIKKTNNYAGTWTNVLTSVSHLNNLYFPTNNVGYVVGDSGLVYKTSNAGSSWSKYNIPANNNLYTVHFTNPDTGYVAGASGALYKTLNGGLTWSAEASTDTNTISMVQMVNDSTVYFWDSYNLYKNNYANSTTSIKKNVNETNFNIYPNPAQNNFTIETNSNDKQNLKITDVNGKQILAQTINGTTSIDVSSLSAGIYNLSLTSSQSVANKRLVIIK